MPLVLPLPLPLPLLVPFPLPLVHALSSSTFASATSLRSSINFSSWTFPHAIV